MKPILFLLAFSLSLSAIAQNPADVQIQEIRNRFYRLQDGKVKLKELQLDHCTYYFEQDHLLRKVVEKEGNTTREFYFDLDWVSDIAYFVYTYEESNGRRYDNRYYFNTDQSLIRWLDGDKQIVSPEEEYYCAEEKEYQARAEDMRTRLRNHRSNEAHPDHLRWETAINQQREAIDQLTLLVDTTEIIDAPEEYYYSETIEYRYPGGTLARKVYAQSGDHGGSAETTYYDQNGQLIYRKNEEGNVFGGTSVKHEYFRSEQVFRTRTERSAHSYNDECEGYRHAFLPTIEDQRAAGR